MFLSKVRLSHFRNFSDQLFTMSPSITMILGENARGKTNLLESIFFSLNGIGFRESREEELLQWNESRTVIETVWTDKDTTHLFQILLQKRDNGVDKKYYIDKTQKSLFHYRQYLGKAVLFAPEHIDIITGSPDIRRDYMNKFIGTYDIEYKKKLRNYDTALRKRNKILEDHQDIRTLVEELAFWNTYLEEHALYITTKREKYIDYLNKHPAIDGRLFTAAYIKSIFTKERREQYFEKERMARRTLIGPQKDDIRIFLTKEGIQRNVQSFGSRSEQRMAVLWLKLNEMRILEELFKKKPILLLDDIFSELDKKNKKLTMDLAAGYQTVLTSTEAELEEMSTAEHTVINL